MAYTNKPLSEFGFDMQNKQAAQKRSHTCADAIAKAVNMLKSLKGFIALSYRAQTGPQENFPHRCTQKHCARKIKLRLTLPVVWHGIKLL